MLDFMSSVIMSIFFVQMLTLDCILSFEHRKHSGKTTCVYFPVYSYFIALYHTLPAYLGLLQPLNYLIVNSKRQLIYVHNEN